VKVVKVTKPSDDLAITVELGHDQQIKVDPIAIAGENFKLTGARRLRRHPAMYHRRCMRQSGRQRTVGAALHAPKRDAMVVCPSAGVMSQHAGRRAQQKSQQTASGLGGQGKNRLMNRNRPEKKCANAAIWRQGRR